APPGCAPTLDELLISAREDRPDELGLERLVRRGLRSALEQFCNRNECDLDERPGKLSQISGLAAGSTPATAYGRPSPSSWPRWQEKGGFYEYTRFRTSNNALYLATAP